MGWREQLDEILPTEPGVDLGFFADPDEVARYVRRGMAGAALRLRAPRADLDAALDALLGEIRS